MKKFFLSFFFITAFVIYAIVVRGNNPMSPVLVQNKSLESSSVPVPVVPSGISPVIRAAKVIFSDDEEAAPPVPKKAAPAKVATPAPALSKIMGGIGGNMGMGMMGAYKDGEYTGSIADAYYGNVEVKAVISGGKLADVQFLQYPNDRRHSLELSNYAMPQLKSEAIQVQSAQVDSISGASDTSEAFKESLAVALSKAKNT